jgi:hypothetical protein
MTSKKRIQLVLIFSIFLIKGYCLLLKYNEEDNSETSQSTMFRNGRKRSRKTILIPEDNSETSRSTMFNTNTESKRSRRNISTGKRHYDVSDNLTKLTPTLHSTPHPLYNEHIIPTILSLLNNIRTSLPSPSHKLATDKELLIAK